MCDDAKLAAMIAGLDGYIDRRATEIAAERVRASHERAERLLAEMQEAVGDVQAGLRLKDDLIAELRRRIASLEKQREQRDA